jgi:hypothetical protein
MGHGTAKKIFLKSKELKLSARGHQRSKIATIARWQDNKFPQRLWFSEQFL